MAGKRSAASDLNHDNWDREDDVEEAGTFQKAADDILKRRVIKTARRRNPLITTTDNGEESTKKAVFGGFTGFSSFAPPNPNSAFSFLTNTSSTSAPNTTMTNGIDSRGEKKATTAAPPATATTTTTTTTLKGETKKKETTESEDSEPDRTEYYAKLKGLNESVLSWIEKHVKENPFINLKPIFADYDRHITDLEVKHIKVNDVTKKELTTFSFKTPPSSKPSSQTSIALGTVASGTVLTSTDTGTTNVKKFTFGSQSQSTKDTETSSSAPTFVFGSTHAAKATSGNDVRKAFMWQQSPSQTALSGPGLFSNTTWPKPQQATPSQRENTENEDEDEPPKVEFTPVVEDDHIYTIRCKVFVKKDGNFGDRGVGNMYLKRVPDTEKVQLIVRADTNLGNLLCNFILSESVPTQRMGKKDVMLVCIPTPDFKPPPIPILLRVKSSEEADTLLKELEKHKK